VRQLMRSGGDANKTDNIKTNTTSVDCKSIRMRFVQFTAVTAAESTRATAAENIISATDTYSIIERVDRHVGV